MVLLGLSTAHSHDEHCAAQLLLLESDAEVGKTSMLRRYENGRCTMDVKASVSMEFVAKSIKAEGMRIKATVRPPRRSRLLLYSLASETGAWPIAARCRSRD